MNSLVYLLVPLTVAAVVVAVIYWRDRKPTSVNDGIEQFRDGLRALAPDNGPQLPQSPPPGPGSYSSYGSPDARSAAAPVPADRAASHHPERQPSVHGAEAEQRGDRGLHSPEGRADG